MFFIAYAFKREMHVFAGQVKIVSYSSSRTSAILKYFLSPGDHTCFHALTFARFREMCLNTRPLGRVFKHPPRDPASVNAMKYT